MSVPFAVLKRTLLTSAPRLRLSTSTTTVLASRFSSRPSFHAFQNINYASRRAFAMATEAAKDGGVHNLASKSDWENVLKEKGLLVLDCFATWCGPCKMIAPKVVEFSKEYTNVRFYKIDVDEVPDVAQELGIRAMPTFLLFKDGEKVEEVVGANPNAIKAAIEKHA
ncbi:thioredoxin [Verruconis gallopava]|uniref:Thioredoxin n=1 Tax=Verruconis gallopava TaxID=253628 RepID=A0A0D2A5N1_9PEZI|nr:thioredoxin [Verruconis gallopava]KIW01855.1 thioredoxin [Verruconis gallopava]